MGLHVPCARRSCVVRENGWMDALSVVSAHCGARSGVCAEVFSIAIKGSALSPADRLPRLSLGHSIIGPLLL